MRSSKTELAAVVLALGAVVGAAAGLTEAANTTAASTGAQSVSTASSSAGAPAAGALASENRWQPVFEGLYGDTVVDVVFVGETARANRSMLLLSFARGRGRGVYRLQPDGSWSAVTIHPEGERRRIKALVSDRADNTNQTVYAGLEGAPLLARSSDGGKEWTAVTGPTGPRRFDVVASCKTGRLYAAEQGTNQFHTTGDGGDTWASHEGPNSVSTIDDIFTAPDGPDVYLVSGGILYRSSDDPDNWTVVLSSATDPSARVEMAAVARGRILYAIVEKDARITMVASDDGGATWPYGGWPAGVERLPYAILAGDIDLTQTSVWIGIADGTIIQSSSGGTTWSEVGELPISPTVLAFDEETNDVWAGTDGLGLFRVGESPIQTGTVPVEVLAVTAPNYEEDGLVLASARISLEQRDRYGRLVPERRAIFESTRGDVWTRRTLTVGLGTNLLASPAFGYDDRLYSGQMMSKDGGKKWMMCGGAAGGDVPHIMAVGPITGTSPALYALSEPYVDEMIGGGGLLYSDDDCASWRPAEAPSQGLVSIVVSPDFAEDRTAFAANYKGLVFRTINTVTFLQAGRIPTLDPLRNLYEIVLSPDFASDQTVVVAMEDASDVQRAHVYISTSAGEGTWQDRSIGLNEKSRPRRIILSPSFGSDGVGFVGTAVRSTDPDVPLIYASQGDRWFGEYWLRPASGRTAEVLDFAWGGTLEDGRIFAALGDLGLVARTLDGVPVPPPTATPTITATPQASDTPSRTPTPTSTPTASSTSTLEPGDTATATSETETATATSSAAPASATPTCSASPTELGTSTTTPTATATVDATPTFVCTRARVYLPFAEVSHR